jgi:hypothetical protein
MDNTTKIETQKTEQKKAAKAVFKNDSLVLTVPAQKPDETDDITDIILKIFESMRKNAEKTGVKTMSRDALDARFCNLVNKRVESALIPLTGKARTKEYVSIVSLAYAVGIDCIGRDAGFISVTRDAHGKTSLEVTDTRPAVYTDEKTGKVSETVFDLLKALDKLSSRCTTERQSLALAKAVDAAKSVMSDGSAESAETE